MHEPGLPEEDHRKADDATDHRIPDADDTLSAGNIFLTIIKAIAILVGILIFLVILGLFVLYLVCAFG